MENRLEKCIFEMTFDKKKFKKLKKEIGKICDIKLNVLEGDTVNLTYNLRLEYYNCALQLKAILKIAQKYGREVINISTEELTYGECLIQEVFLTFQKIKEVLDAK